MTTESDKLLIQRLRDNPKPSRAYHDAFAELHARYVGRLTAYARRRMRANAAVDDVVQNTFIGFEHSLPNYDDRRDLLIWLFTIAGHKVTDQLRRDHRARTGTDPDDQLPQVADFRQRAASSLARSGERREAEETALGRALQLLVREWKAKGDYRSVKTLELLLVKGWGNKDVAALVGVTEQQVANLKFQAKKRLTDHLRAAKLSPDIFPELAPE